MTPEHQNELCGSETSSNKAFFVEGKFLPLHPVLNTDVVGHEVKSFKKAGKNSQIPQY